MPSTISPAVSRSSASAVPIMPGSRALIGGMALNRWVTPVAPSATACVTTAADASLWPIETRTPAAAKVRTKPTGTHSGASVTNDRPTPASSHNSSRSPARGWHDPVGRVDTRAPRTDERPFQVQPENAVPARAGARRRDRAPHLLAGVGDQSRQARGRAKAAVRPGNFTHAVRGRPIVEQHPAPAIDLQIDEARGEDRPGRQAHPRPIVGNLAGGPDPVDAAVANQHRGRIMPAVAVKNTVRQDGVAVGA